MVPVRCPGHIYKLRCFTCSQLLSFNTDLSEIRLSGPLRAFTSGLEGELLRYVISFTRKIGSKSLKFFAIGKQKGANSVSKIEFIVFFHSKICPFP